MRTVTLEMAHWLTRAEAARGLEMLRGRELGDHAVVARLGELRGQYTP
ncbi:MAG: hypothetical protein H0T73_05265, partial [Ardenticatenales bacterium]|nr:hypothetical protein [Ardenticatenales bacterium]